MKTYTWLSLFIFFSNFLFAQGPVSWNFTAKPTGDKTFALQLSASVSEPWHIYSQTSPDGGPLATKIKFNGNQLVTMDGDILETGKLITKHEDVFDIDVKYFERNVLFVQLVKLKANVKTSISGTVEFMACNNEQCIPPKVIPFTIFLK